jgi:hypothetical protein
MPERKVGELLDEDSDHNERQVNGAPHSNVRALIAVDPAYQAAIRKHERPLSALMPDYERVCKEIAECWRIDEVKKIDDKVEALRCYARQIHNLEAQTKLTLIRARAWQQIGKISLTLEKAPHGPGRGHKSRPGSGTAFKIATLRAAGVSRNRANVAEHISRIELKEFENEAVNWLEQGRSVGLEELINTVLKRHQLKPGVRVRPWSNNDEALFGLEANGEKPSYAARTYRMTKRLSAAEKVKHIVRVSADLSERLWHPLLGWVFQDDQVTNLLQDLSQRPVDEHDQFLHRLTRDEHEQYSSVADFVEVTREAQEEQEQPQRPARSRKVKLRKSGNRRNGSETQAAHQANA